MKGQQMNDKQNERIDVDAGNSDLQSKTTESLFNVKKEIVDLLVSRDIKINSKNVLQDNQIDRLQANNIDVKAQVKALETDVELVKRELYTMLSFGILVLIVIAMKYFLL